MNTETFYANFTNSRQNVFRKTFPIFVPSVSFCKNGRPGAFFALFAAKHTIGLNFHPVRAMLSKIHETQ